MRCINKIAYKYEKNNNSITRNLGSILELKNILTRHEIYQIIFEKDSEQYFFNSIITLIKIIKQNKFYYNTVKTDEKIKFRTIKIISDFLNRYGTKNLKIREITSFLHSIS